RDLLKFLLTVSPFYNLKLKITELLGELYLIDHNIDFDNYDLIIIEDIEILPIILKYKKNAKILCDLREFYPLQHENNIKFNILERNYKYLLCKHFLSSCDAIITVSEGISNFFKNWFNLKPQVIMSCPYFIDIAPSKNISNTIKMVHHGAPNRDRKLERMIEIFQFLDERFYLDFYLVNYYNRKYIEHLKKIAEPFQKIRFLNPVSFNDIIPTMNKYDIGLYLLEPTGINTKHALPNKFFEYIQARLMIAIGPSIEMEKLVLKYKLGIVSKTFKPKDLANLLNDLTNEDIWKYKINSDNASHELCFEKESKKLLKIIEEII
ncbi:MAG: capsular biosynthesis protein, partial [Spirochaetota bacterium]